MLHESFLPAIKNCIAKTSIRPHIAYINKDSKGRYEATDSFSLIRITPTMNLPDFPKTETFWDAEPDWRFVDKDSLKQICELAIVKWDKKEKQYPTVIFSGQDSKYEGMDFNFPNELPHGQPTGIDGERLLSFLKSISKQRESLAWFQRNPLSPLQFRMITSQ